MIGKQKKYFGVKCILLLLFYVLYIVVFEIILGFGVTDIWDTLMSRLKDDGV